MPRKPKSIPSETRRIRPTKKPAPPYAALAQGPSPSERLEQLLQDAKTRGAQPADEAALDAMSEVWPEEDLNEFLVWLYQARHEGRYR